MNNQIDLIIKTAEKYVGFKESPANSNSILFNDWYYGRKVSGSAYPWCAVFIAYIFNEAGLSNLLYGGVKTASCTALMSYAKKNGLFYTSGFRCGDLALFNWQGEKTVAQHIGVITGFISGAVQTIEGNTANGNDSDGGEVMRRMRNYGTIIGVYRPEYSESEELTVSQYEELKAIIDTQNERIKELETRTLPKYKTLGEIPEWGQAAITDAINRGILTGVSDSNLSLSWNEVRAITMEYRRESGGK